MLDWTTTRIKQKNKQTKKKKTPPQHFTTLNVFLTLYLAPAIFWDLSACTGVKWVYNISAPCWDSLGQMPGKTCFISAFIYIGPDNSTCFQCQIELLIQHQQCYGSRNNTGQASCFPAPVRKPYKNILQDTRNSMHLPRYKKLTSSEMPRYLANTAWCDKGSRAHLPVPEQQTEHLKHGATFLHESKRGNQTPVSPLRVSLLSHTPQFCKWVSSRLQNGAIIDCHAWQASQPAFWPQWFAVFFAVVWVSPCILSFPVALALYRHVRQDTSTEF